MKKTTTKASIDGAVKALAAAIRTYGSTYNATDIEDALTDAFLTPEQKKELEATCAAFAKQIKAKGDRAKFLANPRIYIEGDKAAGKQGKLQEGDLVEGVGSDKVSAHAGGATVWKNAHLQFVDASGRSVGGKQAELDFLILGANVVNEIVSAKMDGKKVRPATDRGSLAMFYLPSLAPLDLTAVGSTFGAPSAYRNAASVMVVYQDETGATCRMPVSAFQAAYPQSSTAPGVRGLTPQPDPGETVSPSTPTIGIGALRSGRHRDHRDQESPLEREISDETTGTALHCTRKRR